MSIAQYQSDQGLLNALGYHVGQTVPDLVTGTPVNAVAATLTTALTNVNNDMVFTAVTKGVAGNDITIAYVNPATASATLGVVVIDAAIIVNLATSAGVAASTTLGSGGNGTVTITADAIGTAGNSLTMTVVLAGDINLPLSAAKVGNDITVTLGTDGAGVADAAKNTATLIAGVITALAGVSAAASGNGSTAISATSGPTSFTNGAAPIITSTAALIKTAIDASADAHALVTCANYSTDSGAGAVTALTATPLTGGVDGTVARAGQVMWDASYLYLATADGAISTGTGVWHKISLGSPI